MTDITVNLVNACSCSPPVYCGCTYSVSSCNPITYTVKNICTLIYSLDMPVEVIAIPETQVNVTGACQVNCEGEGPITIKVVGNTMTLCVSWVIAEESSSVVSGGIPCLPSITTASDQIQFLYSAFQNRSINYRYTITTSSFTAMPVLLTSINVQLDKSAPATYIGNMKFTVGDNQVSVSEGDTT